MKYLLVFTAFLIPFFQAFGQIEVSAQDKIYVYAEEMPQFAGGQDSMFAFLAKNLRYPEEAIRKNLFGVVFVNFIVDKTGNIKKPEILKSVAPELDAEALSIIGKMPAWQPGKQNGEPVMVKMTLPVRFKFAPEVKKDTLLVYERIEQQPEFPGGSEAMLRFLSTHIKYPKEAHKNRIQGLSVISFVVNEKGNLSNFKIMQRLGHGTDEEAIRVLQAMPLWKPGKLNGKPVRVRYTMPVRFHL